MVRFCSGFPKFHTEFHIDALLRLLAVRPWNFNREEDKPIHHTTHCCQPTLQGMGKKFESGYFIATPRRWRCVFNCRSAALHPGDPPGTHWRGAWVGPRGGLRILEDRKIPCPLRTVQIHRLRYSGSTAIFNLLNPTGHVMHQQFNNQQLYALPTLYLCVLYLSENKQRLVPLTA